ncbi:MAG: type II toxin-antitoxin system RelE/ParE family toxin [Gemmatimonadota bacterium]|nr:type II toxin-antitoxin system RelE/ParE family toxin [Gemmatimonadota bacterium]
MRLALADPAARDLDSIIAYIALDSPAAAEKVFRAIADVAQSLADFPEMGQRGRLGDTRELTVPGLPYQIVYQIAGDTVTVVAVFHTARDLARALADRRKELRKR